jgi:hypothetical protein
LVFARVDTFAQDGAIGVMLDDGVMPGGNIGAAECLRFVPEIAELQFLVAHHAGVRRAPGLVFAGKIIDDEALELVRFIHHVMGNA